MKKRYLILFTAMMSIFSSCDGWLSIQPENDQVSDEYWADKEEVEAVLGAGYVHLRSALQNMLVWGELRGNTIGLGGFFNADLQRFAVWDIIPNNDLVKWERFYQVINDANMVIEYAPAVVDRDPSFSEPIMKSFISEAYFLRALSYFYLVRNFRDVPLVLKPYMDDREPFEVEKSPENDILHQIKIDLVNAIEFSKEIAPSIWETKGRSTKWAIYAALADVYLWTGEYDKAIEACDMVINSGRVGLIDGVVNNRNNWYTIFNPGNSNESIFELQFDFARNQTNSLLSWFGTNFNYVASQHAVFLYESSSEDIRGVGASYTENNFRVWKYLGAEAGTGVPRTNSDQNWIIYRMADIYLMKAEAYVMKGPGSYEDAMEMVTRVRSRAGISQPLAQGGTELEMLSIVMDERGREFLGEGKRWYDLLRVGKRDGYRYKDYLIGQVLISAPASSAPIIRSKLLNEDSHFLPIHNSELIVNTKLVQNPYYENLN